MNAYLWSNTEQLHALDKNTCFFIGLSMTDPNLRRLLDASKRSCPGENSASHYAFLPKDPSCHITTEQTERIMLEMGVNVIWYDSKDNHKELAELVTEIMG